MYQPSQMTHEPKMLNESGAVTTAYMDYLREVIAAKKKLVDDLTRRYPRRYPVRRRCPPKRYNPV